MDLARQALRAARGLRKLHLRLVVRILNGVSLRRGSRTSARSSGTSHKSSGLGGDRKDLYIISTSYTSFEKDL